MPGLCLDHGLIRARMLNAVSALSNVTFKRDARVVRIDQSEAAHLVVNVAAGGETTRYRCRMLIAADGTSSRLARLAGIGVRNRRISTVIGYRISTENFPQREYGQVFLGAATPMLLYPIGRDQARILFDIPYRSDSRATAADCISLAAALPVALREEVVRAIETQPRLSVVTQAITAERSVQGRVVLVGDAGGSCHPLTATGMTMCISDALLLRKALIERASNLPAALQLYQQRRRWPQATRLALADALRDALCGASPELRVVRSGILAHWRDSTAGRAATLALLSTADGRPLVLLRHIVAVMVRGFVAHVRNPSPEDSGIGALTVAWSLLTSLFRHARQILIEPQAPAQSGLAPRRKLNG
jgi:2-polyprenyl-6-methoxyphenol hydroxylase-like FAD-dependent oxidoreductase